MTPKECKAVEKTISRIYGAWHNCGLRANEITALDKKRGQKPGQLCDDWRDMVAAHMKDLTRIAHD